MLLALTGADIAGEGQILPPPPFRARNSQTLSRENLGNGFLGYQASVRIETNETYLLRAQLGYLNTKLMLSWDCPINSKLHPPAGDGMMLCGSVSSGAAGEGCISCCDVRPVRNLSLSCADKIPKTVYRGRVIS